MPEQLKYYFSDLRGDDNEIKTGTAVIRLMSVCNDLSLANTCLSAFKNGDIGTTVIGDPDYINRGAGMYFIRAQTAHFFEGLDVLIFLNKKGNDTAKLIFSSLPEGLMEIKDNLVSICFRKSDTYKQMKDIRNKLTFHYDCAIYKKGLQDKINHPQTSKEYTIILDDDVTKNRFCGADDVIDTVMCRHILKQTGDIDQKAVDDLLEKICNFCLEFYSLGIHFIVQYTSAKNK